MQLSNPDFFPPRGGSDTVLGVRGNEPYFVVTATVDDPTYLNQQFIRTYNYKKQLDASGWEPTHCLPW